MQWMCYNLNLKKECLDPKKIPTVNSAVFTE